MDSIMSFPKIDGFRSIMVAVDRFSKYGIFIPATKECPIEEAARLFLKHVVKYWGVPQSMLVIGMDGSPKGSRLSYSSYLDQT